jgi:multiple sugar transport system permease protein
MATAADVSATTRARRPRSRGRAGARGRQALTGYAFIAPNLLVFAAFMFLPLILTFVKSTQESSGFGPSQYVGLDNYSQMIHDPTFWASLEHTVLYAAVQVPLALAAGLGLAMLINRKLPGRGIFRAIYFIPTVIAAVAAGIVARWMFDENNGVINKMVGLVGIDPLPWNSSGLWAWIAVIVVTLWTSAGFNMVIYLAGLQGIPREYYDAAACDGATPWQQFRHITLPGLRPATFFLSVYGIIGSFQVFDLIFILTHGGPGDSTEVLGTYAYKTAFDTRERGYGAAIGVVLYLLLMVVTLVQWQYNKRRED